MPRWVALSEGQGGSLGWLTVRSLTHLPRVRRASTDATACRGVPLRRPTNGKRCNGEIIHATRATPRLHACPSQAMTFQLRDALRVGNIFLSEGFFSTTMTEREAIAKIRDELCRFAIIVEPAKTIFGKARERHDLTAAARSLTCVASL